MIRYGISEVIILIIFILYGINISGSARKTQYFLSVSHNVFKVRRGGTSYLMIILQY